MLKPSVQIHHVNGHILAEFWDCHRLDPAPIQDLRRHYEDHLRARGAPDLIIDLSGVGFAGSAALGGFLGLRKLSQPAGGRIVFCRVEPTVLEVFRVSKLDTLFSFAPDREAAQALLDAGPDADGARALPARPASSPTPAPLRRRKSS
ncbi:MAG TPA: STAS domain-containing protein [Isosphaeraceae bacterium]|jgi:anti-anti-sigma factor|nr:STAS domain-containing protein [Isosphaeraceae bacterium]